MSVKKLKSHSGAKKRFRFSSTGKVKHRSYGDSSPLSKKSTRKGSRAMTISLSKQNVFIIKAMLPYR